MKPLYGTISEPRKSEIKNKSRCFWNYKLKMIWLFSPLIREWWQSKAFRKLSSDSLWNIFFNHNRVAQQDLYAVFLHQTLHASGLYTEDMNVTTLALWYQQTDPIVIDIPQIMEAHRLSREEKSSGASALRALLEDFHHEIAPNQLQETADALKEDLRSLQFTESNTEPHM